MEENRFLKLLLKTGMKQKDFCDMFKIPYRTVAGWKAGTRKCPEYVLDLIEYRLKHENANFSKNEEK